VRIVTVAPGRANDIVTRQHPGAHAGSGDPALAG
jgi:hypothetical protein